MNIESLHHFVASVPGTFGQQISRNMALEMVIAGRADAVTALQGLLGPDAANDLIPLLVAIDAPGPILRSAIRGAVTRFHRELPDLIERNGGRAVFAAWCRKAGFPAIASLPEVLTIYRGTMGCSPAEAAHGLHWSPKFNSAALFAARYADADGTGMIVIEAKVPRDGIAYYLGGLDGDSVHAEIIPAAVPTSFKVISDKDRIADGAEQAMAFNRTLVGKGWVDSPSYGAVEHAAMAARARMAAAGVQPGTAIVA